MSRFFRSDAHERSRVTMDHLRADANLAAMKCSTMGAFVGRSKGSLKNVNSSILRDWTTREVSPLIDSGLKVLGS